MDSEQNDLKTNLFWINFSKLESNLKQLVSHQFDPSIERELSRLNDLELIKIEGEKTSYYHLVRLLSFFREDFQEKAFKTNINFEMKEPSNLPLPNIFLNE
jgi:hypothetical protein